MISFVRIIFNDLFPPLPPEVARGTVPSSDSKFNTPLDVLLKAVDEIKNNMSSCPSRSVDLCYVREFVDNTEIGGGEFWYCKIYNEHNRKGISLHISIEQENYQIFKTGSLCMVDNEKFQGPHYFLVKDTDSAYDYTGDVQNVFKTAIQFLRDQLDNLPDGGHKASLKLIINRAETQIQKIFEESPMPFIIRGQPTIQHVNIYDHFPVPYGAA